MSKMLSNITEKTRFLLDELFAFISTPRCPGCGILLDNPRLPLCPACELKLSFAGDGPVCLICRSPRGVSCNCQENRISVIPHLYYWATYSPVMRELIHQFKFEGQLKLGKYLTLAALEIIADRIASQKYDFIIPVPMLKRDKRKRSFNQTELIADTISERLDIAVNYSILKKVKKTRLQANLGREERWDNIQNAFEVSAEFNLDGSSCLLADDIVTTGATCWEATKALYTGGVSKVTVFTLVSSHFDEAS
ncbi:MAG: ComF family protein [candidate division Zixibacteria bacterium]|nr:ComF family protein [candidate division Zixibacteria bacterium]